VTSAFRTPEGGRIDRAQPLSFSFDGRQMTGCVGDTLASALLANGVHLVGRSFKYHRPRGIMAAGSEEPNALVTIDRGAGRVTPNLRATQLELYAGMQARSQNRFPSLGFDIGAIGNAVSPLLPAGFYYKTFMWPRAFWRHVYEPSIRTAAGLGRAPTSADPDRYLQHHAHCDVLVIGAGPAGLAAALAASARGARVVLCDEQAEMGGSLLAETAAGIDGIPAPAWLRETLETLDGRPHVTLLPRTTAFGWFPGNLIGLLERVIDHLTDPGAHLPRERLWHVRAKEVVIAAGALERPLVFPGNDRPGIMLAGAARTYLTRYGVKAGTRAVIATADDSTYAAALALREAGVVIAAIADVRPDAGDAARASGLAVRAGTTIVSTGGRLRVNRVRLSNGETIACDALLMCGGWTPSVHLFSQSRGKLRFDERQGAFLPGDTAASGRPVGACNGTFSLATCLEEGYAAGDAASRERRQFAVTGAQGWLPSPVAPQAPIAGKAFVDFQNDVTARDLQSATQEGFRSIEHIKRYTTTGMATDQGKTSNMNTLAIASGLLRQPIPAVGHTTFRMPYTPVTFGALAGTARGALFEPVRQTPMHEWAASQGALFENVGTWQRARCFPHNGEDMHAAVARECRAVRNAVGIFDATTLGKIEVVGPDAVEFLNRMYVNDLARLAVGRCRYGVLLNEAGFVMDDGVVARLAQDRFHVTTTTGGAASVLHHMEDYLQTEFSELRVWLTSITEQWAVIAVQGPSARDVIAPLAEDIDITPMPHMSVREGRICGVPARLFRVSFTGELGFEINVPADYGTAVWDAVMMSGARHGITPYGTETMHVLRAEKGYIIVGQETDGTVIPGDLGLDWAIGKSKPDFVGKRSLARPDMLRADRRQLVGLHSPEMLEEGAQIVADASTAIPMPMLGHVTSAYWSETLRRPIALALVAGGRARMGQTLYVPMPDRTIAVSVVDPVFYDGEGDRLHG
jgi:sarcosine oxidase, subunit alpha